MSTETLDFTHTTNTIPQTHMWDQQTSIETTRAHMTCQSALWRFNLFCVQTVASGLLQFRLDVEEKHEDPGRNIPPLEAAATTQIKIHQTTRHVAWIGGGRRRRCGTISGCGCWICTFWILIKGLASFMLKETDEPEVEQIRSSHKG